MTDVTDATALLRLEIDTNWVSDGEGRLERTRAREFRPVPLLMVGAGEGALCWALSSEVPPALAAGVEEILAVSEPPAALPAVGWAPDAARTLLDLLAGHRPLRTPSGGPAYLVPGGLAVPGDVGLVAGRDGDEHRFRGMMPEHDRTSLLEPWTVAVVDGQVAAVCETARSAPGSVEAGVLTYEPYRRRGLAAAVTAAWSRQVAERTAFYSTSDDNVASQGVARRLGLRPIGHWWQVFAG